MHKEQVRRFYETLWNAQDHDAIPSVLHENFTFRGSLGQEKQGHGGFAEYVSMVHKALGDYTYVIEELVAEENKVFAKMTFTGLHRDEFMGYSPTHCQVIWDGRALFTFEGERISDVWVLGDLKNLAEQMKANET